MDGATWVVGEQGDQQTQQVGVVCVCACVCMRVHVCVCVSGGDSRWQGVKRKDRVCKECNSGEVEDVTHWLLRCPAWSSHQQPLLTFAHPNAEEEIRQLICCLVCRNYNILACIMSMWDARFGSH